MLSTKNLSPLWIIILLSFMTGTCKQSGNSDKTKDWLSPEGVIEVEGFPLKYIRKGSGEPLLVIGSADYYSRAYSKQLEKQFELIYIDSRHFVRDCKISENELNKIDLVTFSSDVDVIRKKLNLKNVGIIGHSVHAQIALDYASRYPDEVSKLILICGVPYNMSEVAALKDLHWSSHADKKRKAIFDSNMILCNKVKDSTTADRQFAVSYHYNAPFNWADPNYDASRLLNELRTCPLVVGKLFSILPSKNAVAEKLKSLKMPTSEIHGKLDFTVPYTAWEELVKVNTKIKFILMENASHNPQTEESSMNEFDRHLTEWIKLTKSNHK